MIEAMARGLPCIGTVVGGIPELLPPEDLVPANDVVALATLICNVLGDSGRRQAMSERNLRHAREYHIDLLSERRLSFYKHVRRATEEWIKLHPGNEHQSPSGADAITIDSRKSSP
jgi:glycosyltransferase involved in cell wall biosynthesis